MKKKLIKITAIILVMAAVLAVPQKATAAEYVPTQSNLGPISEVNDYENTYTNTGDMVKDLIGVALTQVGYHRESGTQTKYGVWYGYPDGAWCAMFISWCADQADISKDVLKKFCRCTSEVTWFKTNNQWQNPVGYTPKAGDIVFFSYSRRIDHVGIVIDSDATSVYCVEGNHADSVNVTCHSLSSSLITGYGTPDYEGQEYAGVTYRTHVRSYGWLDWAGNGETAGTTEEARRAEAVQIKVDSNLDGGVEYRVHVQGHGWLDWASNGETAGTTGEARRAEAVEIRLTGELAEKYDVEYRVHVQGHGWLDWVSNGETAGTTGEARRMEAIQVVLVPK